MVVQAEDCSEKGSSAVRHSPSMCAGNFGEQSSHMESFEQS